MHLNCSLFLKDTVFSLKERRKGGKEEDRWSDRQPAVDSACWGLHTHSPTSQLRESCHRDKAAAELTLELPAIPLQSHDFYNFLPNWAEILFIHIQAWEYDFDVA